MAPDDARTEPKNEERPKRSDPSLTVVGIGASAGGLAALKAFFQKIPADSGLAFVVVVHLSPDHESHLATLLQPHVAIPVQQVNDTTRLEPDQVYVIPPNRNLSTIDTHLRLTPLEEQRRERAPIDHFLRTLAATHDGHAIGVILSGTGSDGALGIKDIKASGGITLVQDPDDAEYSGMPDSAVATGVVDEVLPLSELPEAVVRLGRTAPRLHVAADGEELEGDTRQFLQKVFAHVRARTGRDFSRYKRSTILRRIGRRMQLQRIEEPQHYIDLLREQPSEVRALADDLLITVTSFFRDPEVFEKVEHDVLPKLLAGKRPDEDIRIWTVGCATGEEAYSLAMLMLEAVEHLDAPPRIQIFASDLHEHSLAFARDGFYTGDIEHDVSAERLRRFFHQENGGYRVRKQLREMVVFAPHNLLSDPPFSRIDLICCRNVLIYLQRQVQGDIVELFHYALRPDGYLVVGTSEKVDNADLFQVEDKKRCIYKKRNVPGPEPRLPVFPLTRSRLLGEPEPQDHGVVPIVYGMLHQRMVERYAPPSILVSPDDKVVHLSENAGRYLVHPGGEITANVFKLVREELRLDLRAAVHEARQRGKAIRTKPVPVRLNSSVLRVVAHVRPALEPEREGFVLVIFDEEESLRPGAEGGESGDESEKSLCVQQLEAELDAARQRLQTVIEEFETSQEEMKAANEELQSTNEELRSTMEELETSKEELQSMNEELQTVNQENRHKVEELAQLSGDLNNLLVATDIATLFLDRDLRILRFTPKVAELFNVRPTDRGRPLSDLTHHLGYPELASDAARVLDRLAPIEREVRDQRGRLYLTRVLPYRSFEDRIGGVVITFVDITERRHVEDAKDFAEQIIATLPDPLLVLTPDLKVKAASAAFFAHFRVQADRTIGETIYSLGNGQWDIPSLRDLLEKVLPHNDVFQGYIVEHDFDDLGHRVMVLNGRRLDHVQLILLGIRDVTEQHRAEQALRRSEAFHRLATEAGEVGTWELHPDTRRCFLSSRMARLLGYEGDGGEGDDGEWRQVLDYDGWLESVHPDDRDRMTQALAATFERGQPFDLQLRIRLNDGRVRWLHSKGRIFEPDDGGERRLRGASIDITARKQMR